MRYSPTLAADSQARAFIVSIRMWQETDGTLKKAQLKERTIMDVSTGLQESIKGGEAHSN